MRVEQDAIEVTADLGAAVAEQVGRVIVGKADQTRLVTTALLAGGHVLIDDVPGVAKTLLVRTFAASLGLSFSRLQCTADLLPADVTGSTVFDQRSGSFSFRPGPVFANVVLADEVNRATPRTQSAFLEAMEERGVTVDGDDPPAATAVPRARHAEPGGAQGHLPAARSAARPLPAAPAHGLSQRGRGDCAMLERFRAGDPLAEVAAVDVARGLLAARARRAGRARGRRTWRATWSR